MKPFLKWAGNKYKIVARIKAVLPAGERLVEPFVGSGALFLNTDYPSYLLTDANADLINLYRNICKRRAKHSSTTAAPFSCQKTTRKIATTLCAPSSTKRMTSRRKIGLVFVHEQARLQRAVPLQMPGVVLTCRLVATNGRIFPKKNCAFSTTSQKTLFLNKPISELQWNHVYQQMSFIVIHPMFLYPKLPILPATAQEVLAGLSSKCWPNLPRVLRIVRSLY